MFFEYPFFFVFVFGGWEIISLDLCLSIFDVVLFVFLPKPGKGGGERVFSCCNLTLREEDSVAQRENGSAALSHRPQVNHWGDIRPRKLKMEFAKIELFLGTTASL